MSFAGHGLGRGNAPISSSCSLSPAASCSNWAILACICFCCSDGSADFFALPFFARGGVGCAGAMETEVEAEGLLLASMLRDAARGFGGVEVGYWWATAAIKDAAIASPGPAVRRAPRCRNTRRRQRRTGCLGRQRCRRGADRRRWRLGGSVRQVLRRGARGAGRQVRQVQGGWRGRCAGRAGGGGLGGGKRVGGDGVAWWCGSGSGSGRGLAKPSAGAVSSRARTRSGARARSRSRACGGAPLLRAEGRAQGECAGLAGRRAPIVVCLCRLRCSEPPTSLVGR